MNYQNYQAYIGSHKPHWFVATPLILYFIFSPLYLFPSGLPQVGDFFISLGAVSFLLVVLFKSRLSLRPVFLIGLCFAVYTIFVNLLNYSFYPHNRFLLSSFYYVYNIGIFIYLVLLFEKHGNHLKDIISNILPWIVLAQIIWAVSMPQDHWREIGTFNNPNQLAYWALITAFMIVLVRKKPYLNLWEIVSIAILASLQALALSKVGIISFSVFLLLLICSPVLKTSYKYALIVLIFLAMPFLFFKSEDGTVLKSFIEAPVERIQNIGQEPDDSAEARGYKRPIEFPIYTLLGAGEGAYDRFEPNDSYELHSGIVTILFSYGVFGFGLFIAFMYFVFKQKPLYIVILTIPIFMVGLTGQSFRFTHFWVLMAIIYTFYQSGSAIQRKG